MIASLRILSNSFFIRLPITPFQCPLQIGDYIQTKLTDFQASNIQRHTKEIIIQSALLFLTC